jgi:hypothetical protein
LLALSLPVNKYSQKISFRPKKGVRRRHNPPFKRQLFATYWQKYLKWASSQEFYGIQQDLPAAPLRCGSSTEDGDLRIRRANPWSRVL